MSGFGWRMAARCSRCRLNAKLRYCICRISHPEIKPVIRSEELESGVELRFGTETVTVVEARDDGELGIWVELSTGDMGYCDRGVKYDMRNPL